VVVSADPRSSSHHRNNYDHQGNDTPRENHLGSVLCDVALESTDDQEDEPGNTRGSASRVNATDLLNETG
jgi:hypothetical protein